MCYLRLLKKQLDTDSKTKLNGKKLIQLSNWKFKLEGIGKIKIITWLLQKKKKKKIKKSNAMLSQLVCILDNKLSRQPIMQLLNFIFIILIKRNLSG